MNHDDDLEQLISGSLASRSERIGSTGHSLDDVHRRVELRRGRRRHVAAFGATAMLAAGAFALTAIGSSDPAVTPLVPADAADQADVQTAWRCTGQLDVSDGSDATFFADCQFAAVDANGAVISVPVSTVPLYPTTTSVCLAAPTTDVAVTTVPCTWGAPPTTPVQEVTHQVEAGETLASISAAYGIPIEEIVSLNAWGGRSDVTLVEGETIVIALRPISPASTVPVPTSTTTTTFDGRFPLEQEYTVQPGDSLVSISDMFGITLEQLINYNQFADGADHLLVPGERLFVPPNAFVMYDTQPGSPPVTTTTSIP